VTYSSRRLLIRFAGEVVFYLNSPPLHGLLEKQNNKSMQCDQSHVMYLCVVYVCAFIQIIFERNFPFILSCVCVNVFIVRLYTRPGTTRNYNAVAYLHTYKSLHAKSSPACSVFTSRCLVTALNNGDSSVSVLTSLQSVEYPTTEL
jgi:hypothetical protein